jgi:hypothetical protein
MASNVSDVEKLLLRVFGIFGAHLVGNTLCLLGKCISDRYGNCETQQGHGRQSEGGKSVHDVPPGWVCLKKSKGRPPSERQLQVS